MVLLKLFLTADNFQLLHFFTHFIMEDPFSTMDKPAQRDLYCLVMFNKT